MHVAVESWGVHAQLSLPVNTASFRGWSGSLSNNSSLGDDAPQTAPSSVQPFFVWLTVTIRYDTRCYFNVRSKADISQLNLPHGTDN